MKLKEIEAKIGGLSNTSKMPAYSWGISAKDCKTGKKLALIDGTICNKCYANKGCYVFKVVQDAHKFRLQAVELNEWVDYMIQLITIKYKKLDKSRLYHRWFDSGDIQSYSHLMKIFEVCENTPHIKHLIATREYSIVDKVDEKDVHKDKRHKGRECPAYKQNNECGNCRACWNRNIKQISYKEH